MTLTDDFMKVTRGEKPSEDLIVPLMIWFSGSEKNIEGMQKINKRFVYTNRKILIGELTLNNNIRHFIKYPSNAKEDEKMDFYYNDICKYYGWTRNEFFRNLDVIPLETLKPTIATLFGYDDKQRKLIGLEGITHAKTKSRGKTISRRDKNNKETTSKNNAA